MKLRVTKFVHACLLVETDDTTTLIDPGQMSVESGLLKIENFARLDAIAITHEHFDHFDPNFTTELIKKFPGSAVISTPSVLAQLREHGIERPTSHASVTASPLPHESMEPLSGGVTAENVMVEVLNALTHPGDSYQLTSTKAVLALPLAGPWGAAIEGIQLAEKLKPTHIIPIHDWMWNDAWRLSMYDRCEQYFSSKGITFLKPVDGQQIELDLG